MKRQISLLLAVATCLVLAALVRGKVSSARKAWEKRAERIEEKQRLVPERSSSVELMDFLSTGMKPLVANIYWTKATTLKSDEIFEMQRDSKTKNLPKILMDAEIERTRRDDYELYELLRYVTYFDPNFEYAYFYGSHLLAFDGNIDLAISLLRDGLKKNPKSGMIPGMLSFIYYYFLKDWKAGAEYAQMSWRKGGKYSAPTKGVVALYAAGNDYKQAIDFLYEIRASIKDPTTLEQIDMQLRYLLVEKDIDFLQTAVERYAQLNKRLPPDLGRLAYMNYINALPIEPFGGKYVLGKDGLVTNDPPNRFTHYKQMKDHKAGDFHFSIK